MDPSEDVRESERERCESLHDVVATTHACDRFVVRNPPAWHSGNSGTRRCENCRCRSLSRRHVGDSGWSSLTRRSWTRLVLGHCQEAERNHSAVHVVLAPHVGGSIVAAAAADIAHFTAAQRTAGRGVQARSVTANHANHAKKPSVVAVDSNPAVLATADAHPTARLEESLNLV
jgi:hypothetical protein